jgi:hypothetical protein
VKVIFAIIDGSGAGADSSSLLSAFVPFAREIIAYQGYQIVQEVSLPDRHSCQTFVVNVNDMDVEVVCCQLA